MSSAREAWLASCGRPPEPSCRPEHTARPENLYPHTRSKAAPLRRQEFGGSYFQRPSAVELFQPRQKIRPRRRRRRLDGQQSRDDALAFGDLYLLALTQKVFHQGKPVAQVSYRCLPHVMHFSIT